MHAPQNLCNRPAPWTSRCVVTGRNRPSPKNVQVHYDYYYCNYSITIITCFHYCWRTIAQLHERATFCAMSNQSRLRPFGECRCRFGHPAVSNLVGLIASEPREITEHPPRAFQEIFEISGICRIPGSRVITHGSGPPATSARGQDDMSSE